MILVDTQSVNPFAKHTVSIYLFGKTLAAAGCWYVIVKLFHPYSDLRASLEALVSAMLPAEIAIARGRVFADVMVRLAAAILIHGIWSTV